MKVSEEEVVKGSAVVALFFLIASNQSDQKFTLPAVADSGSSTPPTVFVGEASFSTRILQSG